MDDHQNTSHRRSHFRPPLAPSFAEAFFIPSGPPPEITPEILEFQRRQEQGWKEFHQQRFLREKKKTKKKSIENPAR